MKTIVIENECGQEVTVTVSNAVADFINKNDAYMDRLHNIDSKHFRLLHFDKAAWENMDELSTGYSAEDEVFGVQELQALSEYADYQKRLALCREKLHLIQSKCTESQWRRFVLNKVYAMPMRLIAEKERCYVNAVFKSVEGVEKKIKKCL